MTKKNYYITTPLYYVNDELHIGHATTTLYADTMARFKELDGFQVKFLTGSDEHGQKIFKAAQKAGLSPKAFADKIVGKFQEVWEALGIREHQFIRTTDAYHEKVVQSLFQRLKEKDLVYKAPYQALYCTDCEQAYSPSQLLDGSLCPIHKTQVIKLSEENYFFRLSAFEKILRSRLDDDTLAQTERAPGIEADPNAILPLSKRNEILGKVREGLENISISRTAFDWGVEMPGDSEHVLWVWFDALVNYISALVQTKVDPQAENLQDIDHLCQALDFQENWPVAHHFIGKDILWHHSVVWWSMLNGAGLTMPHRVYAHGWWTVEGEKMSKTLGNIIRPTAVAERYGQDQLRYFVLREGPVKEDANWQATRFHQRINNDLSKELGNLFSRITKMLWKYCDGAIPALPQETFADATLHTGIQELKTMAQELPEKLRKTMDVFAFPQALEELWKLVRTLNRFIDQTEPFKRAKVPEQRQELLAIMHALFQSLKVLSFALAPFLPNAALRMREELGLNDQQATNLDDACSWLVNFENIRIAEKSTQLFPRIEENK